MLKCLKSSVWGIVLAAFFAASLAAQSYVYTNNDTFTGPNSVSGYSVDSSGSLSQISGSPFSTGGTGTSSTALPLYGATRVVVVNDFLYASNAGSNTVSAFTIDLSSNGALVPIGSPVATDGSDDSSKSGISLAATPDGKYLYAATTDGTITVFSINDATNPPAGGLTKVGSVSADGPIYSMKVTPNGDFLVLPVYAPASGVTNSYGLDVYDIRNDKTLQTAPKTLFRVSPEPVTSVDINCASSLVYAGRSNVPDIDVFTLDPSGTLSELANSPFSTSSGSYQVVALSLDDKTLFSSNPGTRTVTAFPVLFGVTGTPDGSLDVPNATSSLAAGTSGLTVFTGPSGLAVSKDSSLNFLFAADTSVTGGVGAISTFGLDGSTPLTFDSLTYPIPNPYPTGQISKLQSVAAYPAKACSSTPPPSAGLSVTTLQISSGPPPAFELDATLTLDSSAAADPLTQPVTIQIGDFTLALPAGSFKTFQEGRNAETYLFQGVINSTTLKIQITPLGGNQYQIHALDKQVDLTGLDASTTVTVGIGDHSASAGVTATFPSFLRGNWRDQ